jgi:integrase
VENRILPEFQNFLVSRSLVPEKNVSFYAYWVSKFLAFSNRNQDLGPDLRVEKFLNHLRTQKNISDWQIRQADDALRLYIHPKLHLNEVKKLHNKDLAGGNGEVYLPDALERKYPNAAKEWGWQYVFPALKLSVDPRSGKIRRHHISEKTIQNAVKEAVKKAGIVKHASVHTLRHSFATHLLMNRVNIREIQNPLGHKHVETTMIYTHVIRDAVNIPKSPLDALYANSPLDNVKVAPYLRNEEN